MYKRALGVHEVELMINARKHFSNRGRVGNHAHCTFNFSKIATRNISRRLPVDTALEPGRAPIDKLDRLLVLDRQHRRVHVLWHDVTAVHEAARHVLSLARIAFRHHCGWLKRRRCDLVHRHRLVVRLLRRENRRVRRKHEMNARIRHQVGLELIDINVERAVETERRGDGRNHLRNQAVQVSVRRALDVERVLANVVNRLVVQHHGDVRVL
mmetsp:Transcript_6727/g.14371  ORF Transcript_6727/g.14371 Transcript_6727/m.14371 type:complete len:212 (-) Transcript_6727:421-1056(-)